MVEAVRGAVKPQRRSTLEQAIARSRYKMLPLACSNEIERIEIVINSVDINSWIAPVF